MVNILFWLFVLAFDLLLPVVMIFFGREFMKNPPKEINPGYGYRTAMSSKNQDTWDFAQRKMGEVWYKWGKILLIPSALPLLFVPLALAVGDKPKLATLEQLNFDCKRQWH